MKLQELLKIKTKSKKRVGRGNGSGKGKTAARGEKGQKKRGKVKIGFEGGQLPLYKRLPQKRGVGNIQNAKKFTITTRQLNSFAPGTLVDVKIMRESGFVPTSVVDPKIRIVYSGKLEKKLKINLPASKKAISIIEKAGGKIVNENTA